MTEKMHTHEGEPTNSLSPVSSSETTDKMNNVA